MGWFSVYINGSQVRISKIVFALANSVDPDEMPQHVAFHLRFHYCSSITLGVTSIQRI